MVAMQTAQVPNYQAMSKSDLIAIIENQKITINNERERRKQLEGFLTNSKLPIAARYAGYATQQFKQQVEPDTEGYYKAYLPEMAKIAGVSPSTISRGLAILSDATDALDKYTHDERDENGRKEKSLLYFRPREIFETPAAIEPIKEIKRHGGARIAKCECGGELIVKERVLKSQQYTICTSCGTQHIYQARTVNEEITPTADEYEEIAPLQDATGEITQAENQQNVDLPASEETTIPLQDAILTFQVHPVASCNSSQDVERDAAELLLGIPGQHRSHIQMCKNGDAKYITIPQSLDLGDIRTHLRGYKTKGVVSRPLDGETRALWFEGDTPEQWQRCEEAGRMLTAVGFKPLHIPSPTTGKHVGGGHMWVIFDGMVDAYSALQTVYDYTADLLRDCKEHWPGGGVNVRLPGGKYVYNCDAWCDLFDAYGCQLSYNGAGAALALLEHQTPAGLVTLHTKPDPAPEAQRTEPTRAQGRYLDKDVARQVISDFNAVHSWDSLLGESRRSGKYLAVWRGDRTPNVSVNPRTDLAKDFAQPDEPAMDQYDCWCRIEAARSGEDWKMFRKRDLAERCAQLRNQQAPYAPPDRPTVCCNAGWRWTGEQYVCTGCHGKPERRAS